MRRSAACSFVLLKMFYFPSSLFAKERNSVNERSGENSGFGSISVRGGKGASAQLKDARLQEKQFLFSPVWKTAAVLLKLKIELESKCNC